METFDPEINIKGIRVNWEPGEDFKNLRQGVTFEAKCNKRNQRKILMAEKRGDATIDIK